MQPFVRHALAGSPVFSIRGRNELQLQPRDPDRRRLPDGHGAKAFLAKRMAVTGGYDIVIFMVDADSNEVGDWRRIVDEIDAGFQALVADIRCVACVPMAASESWLLSDAQAWRIVAGREVAGLPRRQRPSGAPAMTRQATTHTGTSLVSAKPRA